MTNNQKSIFKIFSFIVLLFFSSVALDYLYKTKIISGTVEERKERQFNSYDDTLKYLFLGDSHVQNTLNADSIPNSYNFSAANENFIQTYFKFVDVVEKKEKKPEYILLPVDLAGFSGFRSERFMYDNYWVKYMNYFELTSLKNDPVFLFKYLTGKFWSYAGQYEKAYRFYHISQMGFGRMQNGFLPRIEKFSDKLNRDEIGKKRANLYLNSENYFDKDLELYFRKILMFAKENDIKVILVRFPVSEEYFAEAEKIVPIKEYYDRVNKIVADFPNVILQLDYHDKFFGQAEKLRNADHVNYLGAPEITTLFKHELEKLD